jgi:hypothetical protein
MQIMMHDYSFQLHLSNKGASLLVGAGRFFPDRGGSKRDNIFGPRGLRATLVRDVLNEGPPSAAVAANGSSHGSITPGSEQAVEIEHYSLCADAAVQALMLGLVAPQAATMLVEAIVREALASSDLRAQIEAYIAEDASDAPLDSYGLVEE